MVLMIRVMLLLLVGKRYTEASTRHGTPFVPASPLDRAPFAQVPTSAWGEFYGLGLVSEPGGRGPQRGFGVYIGVAGQANRG